MRVSGREGLAIPGSAWVGDLLRRSRVEIDRLPGPFRREGLAFRLLPLLLAAIITVILRVGPNPALDERVEAGVIVGVGVLFVAGFLVPWHRLPRYIQGVPPLVALVSVLAASVGGAGTDTRYTPLLLLPVMWLALFYSWLELVLGAALVVGVLAISAVTSQEPLSTFTLDLVYVGTSLAAGFAAYAVVARMHDHVVDVAGVSEVMRRVSNPGDTAAARLAVCEGVREVSRAAAAALLEIEGDRLVCTAAAPAPIEVDLPLAGVGGDAGGIHPALAALRSGESKLVAGRATLPIPAWQQRSVLWQPVVRDTRAVALLCVAWDWPIQRLADREAMAVSMFALEAAAVIARAEAVDRLNALVRTDSLTGLWNRRAWDEELPRYMARAARSSEPMCVAAVDLDHFKAYNDDWGHGRGDRLLRDVGTAWEKAVREIDLLARFGGDEFAIVLPDCDLPSAQVVLRRLMALLPEGQTGSAGIAQWDGTESGESLLARADAALYDSKRHQGDVVSVAEIGSQPALFHWTDVVPRILRERSIRAVYQPIRLLETGQVLGYEALARPLGTANSASVEGLFAAAHRMGAWRDMDWLCRRQAVQGAAKLLPRGTTLFINVGVRSLLDPVHDVDQMLLLLRWAQLSPTSVVLEISEREAVNEVRRFKEVLRAYRSEGFRFALDDVGEGHSTLETLTAADAEYVKLARSLIVEAEFGSRRALVRALVEYGLSAGSQLIAEGIETEAQRDTVRAMGVTLGQGWLLGRPAPLEQHLSQDEDLAAAAEMERA